MEEGRHTNLTLPTVGKRRQLARAREANHAYVASSRSAGLRSLRHSGNTSGRGVQRKRRSRRTGGRSHLAGRVRPGAILDTGRTVFVRSGDLHRLLGGFLMVAAEGNLIASFGTFLLSTYEGVYAWWPCRQQWRTVRSPCGWQPKAFGRIRICTRRLRDQ